MKHSFLALIQRLPPSQTAIVRGIEALEVLDLTYLTPESLPLHSPSHRELRYHHRRQPDQERYLLGHRVEDEEPNDYHRQEVQFL